MKSNSAGPDLRLDLALQGGDGSLVARDQLGDDDRIGLDRSGRSGPRRHRGGSLVRERPHEVTAIDDGLQRVPDQRIGSPQDVQEAGADRRRGQALGDVDEETAADLGHRSGGRQLPEGDPQGLHGVGHHLLMTDGDVDVVLAVVGRGDGEQRGDRPALDDLEVIVDQAPLDVLRETEVRFDPPAQLREPHNLRIRQRRLLLPVRLDRLFVRPACRRGVDGKLLGGDRLGDDNAVPHLVVVPVHQARDQSLAEAEAGLHGGDLPVARDRVSREEDAGRLRKDHLLHDHAHVDPPVVEAVPQAVGHGPLGEERGPAPADVLEDRRRPHDVQVRVLLTGEGGGRQVFCRRARSDGVGGLVAEPCERAGDRSRQVVGDGDRFEHPADLRAQRADRLAVVRVQARQPVEPIVERRRLRHDPLERVRRHAIAGRHTDALDSRKLPQMRALAADERDLRLVDLLEPQHVAAHQLTFLSRRPSLLVSATGIRAGALGAPARRVAAFRRQFPPSSSCVCVPLSIGWLSRRRANGARASASRRASSTCTCVARSVVSSERRRSSTSAAPSRRSASPRLADRSEPASTRARTGDSRRAASCPARTSSVPRPETASQSLPRRSASRFERRGARSRRAASASRAPSAAACASTAATSAVSSNTTASASSASRVADSSGTPSPSVPPSRATTTAAACDRAIASAASRAASASSADRRRNSKPSSPARSAPIAMRCQRLLEANSRLACAATERRPRDRSIARRADPGAPDRRCARGDGQPPRTPPPRPRLRALRRPLR